MNPTLSHWLIIGSIIFATGGISYFLLFHVARSEKLMWSVAAWCIRDPELKRLHQLMYSTTNLRNSSYADGLLEKYTKEYQHRRKVLQTIKKFPELKDAPEEWVEHFMAEKDLLVLDSYSQKR